MHVLYNQEELNFDTVTKIIPKVMSLNIKDFDQLEQTPASFSRKTFAKV